MAASVFVVVKLINKSMLNLQGAVTLEVDTNKMILSADAQVVTLEITSSEQLSYLLRLYKQFWQYYIKGNAITDILSPYTLVITIPSKASLIVTTNSHRQWFPISISTQQKIFWLKALPKLLWRTWR